jgi:hypothetical protein
MSTTGRQEIERIVGEYVEYRTGERLPDSILETALFVESEFGVTFGDDEIDAAHLGSREAIVRSVAAKVGGM